MNSPRWCVRVYSLAWPPVFPPYSVFMCSAVVVLHSSHSTSFFTSPFILKADRSIAAHLLVPAEPSRSRDMDIVEVKVVKPDLSTAARHVTPHYSLFWYGRSFAVGTSSLSQRLRSQQINKCATVEQSCNRSIEMTTFVPRISSLCATSQVMVKDVEAAVKAGAHGVVIGVRGHDKVTGSSCNQQYRFDLAIVCSDSA